MSTGPRTWDRRFFHRWRAPLLIALGLCAGGAVPGNAGAATTCTAASPGDLDYCWPGKCGPCEAGEGDCDPGQCGPGLECKEEGVVDHCRLTPACAAASPDELDYCSSSVCGPCGAGEGDCDPGQCQAGYQCVEEGAVDHCRPVPSSNLQVLRDGQWLGVCCDGNTLEVSTRGCVWTEHDRTLTDVTDGLKLDCPEGDPTRCTCDGSGERMHGVHGDLDTSLRRPGGGPMYSDYTQVTCVHVLTTGELESEWTNPGCPSFRLQ